MVGVASGRGLRSHKVGQNVAANHENVQTANTQKTTSVRVKQRVHKTLFLE